MAVYDAGTTRDGRDFFAMEFVEGRPLGQWISEQGREAALSSGALPRLFALCFAVPHNNVLQAACCGTIRPASLPLASSKRRRAPGQRPSLLLLLLLCCVCFCSCPAAHLAAALLPWRK